MINPCRNPAANKSPAPVRSTIFKSGLLLHSVTLEPLIATLPFSPRGITNGKSVVQTEVDLKKLFPKKTWNKLHLQIIYYGREFCKARECFGLTCKICTTCYPNRKNPIKTKKA